MIFFFFIISPLFSILESSSYTLLLHSITPALPYLNATIIEKGEETFKISSPFSNFTFFGKFFMIFLCFFIYFLVLRF